MRFLNVVIHFILASTYVRYRWLVNEDIELVRDYKLIRFFCLQVHGFLLQTPPRRFRHVVAAEGGYISGPPYAGPPSKPILNSIQSPSDMKSLSLKELKQVRLWRASSEALFNIPLFWLIFVFSPISFLMNYAGKFLRLCPKLVVI